MKSVVKRLSRVLLAGCCALLLPAAFAAEEFSASAKGVSLVMQAQVVEVDRTNREVSLKGPDGNVVTMAVGRDVIDLERVKVGDTLVSTYRQSLEAELRKPTKEELAEPWVVVEEQVGLDDPAPEALGGARVVRAVCTIEGMNRILGTVVIQDARGKLHVIGGVEPEKMEGVTLGQTLVVVHTEALAIALEHVK